MTIKQGDDWFKQVFGKKRSSLFGPFLVNHTTAQDKSSQVTYVLHARNFFQFYEIGQTNPMNPSIADYIQMLLYYTNA